MQVRRGRGGGRGLRKWRRPYPVANCGHPPGKVVGAPMRSCRFVLMDATAQPSFSHGSRVIVMVRCGVGVAVAVAPLGVCLSYSLEHVVDLNFRGIKPKPKPSTLNPKASTLHPAPYTLNPEPQTLNPQHSTLNPQLSNLNFQPSTFNPEPYPLHQASWRLTSARSSTFTP